MAQKRQKCSLCGDADHTHKDCYLYRCKYCCQQGHRKRYCPLFLDKRFYHIFPEIVQTTSQKWLSTLKQKLFNFFDYLEDAKQWHFEFHRRDIRSRNQICVILELQSRVTILQAQVATKNDDQSDSDDSDASKDFDAKGDIIYQSEYFAQCGSFDAVNSEQPTELGDTVDLQQSDTRSNFSDAFVDYPMHCDSEIFHKQMEEQPIVDSDEVIDVQDDNDHPVEYDTCACYAYVPNFAVETMWQQEAVHPDAVFEELEFRDPFNNNGLGFVSPQLVTASQPFETETETQSNEPRQANESHEVANLSDSSTFFAMDSSKNEVSFWCAHDEEQLILKSQLPMIEADIYSPRDGELRRPKPVLVCPSWTASATSESDSSSD